MEKSLCRIKLENGNLENQTLFKCNECSETFHKPLLATVSSMGHVQKYNACPHCLSEITVVKQNESDEKKEQVIPLENVEKVAVGKNVEDKMQCKHFLGYLKNRPKNTPVSDECLTCDKMIECMLH